MNYIALSIYILVGCLIGFLAGYANCVSFHGAAHPMPRPLADSVYEIGGAFIGGAFALVSGVSSVLLAAWKQQRQSNAQRRTHSATL